MRWRVNCQQGFGRLDKCFEELTSFRKTLLTLGFGQTVTHFSLHPSMSGPTFQALHCWKSVFTHIGVGMGAASFWRGAWYILDDQMFPEDPRKSALSCLLLGTAGMTASQGIVARALAVQRPMLKPVARFGALYTVAMSCVLVWRGTWVGWDCVYEHLLNSKTTILVGQDRQQENQVIATSASYLEHSPVHSVIKSTDSGHLTTSGLVSHVSAIVVLASCGVFASVLAPPAAVSVIKDLAIKVARPAGNGTTVPFQRASTKQALEYVPHLALQIPSRSSSSSAAARNMGSSARGFRSATSQFKRYY